jgi:tRNA 2-thiouridine synthesizing protein A
LDARKKVCPIPVLMTRRRLEQLDLVDELEVIVDFPASKEHIERFVQQEGHRIIRTEFEGSLIRIAIEKGSRKL